jgi:stage V sporulation protein G
VKITEVRVKLMDEPGERLLAFCSITFDDAFVVRDLRIIEGATGPFVAMPSRKLTAHCTQCGCKNHVQAAYCCQCGIQLKDQRIIREDGGRAKLYTDIAHPINSACREMIQQRVIAAFEEEKSRATLPDYVSECQGLGIETRAVRPNSDDPAATKPTRVHRSEAPHGPHKIPADRSRLEQSKDGGFGAGIFGQS